MDIADYTLTLVDRRQRLRRSLLKMPNNYYRLIVVLYLMGWQQKEIAAVLGVTRQRIQQTIAEFKRRNGLRSVV